MAPKRLLLFNFVMDLKNPLLSHQIELVNLLATRFEEITVISGKVGFASVKGNVTLLESSWFPGKRIGNIWRLARQALPIIWRGNFDSVFFHMTDVQCAILAPIIRLRGRQQFLWYAHTHKSIYLRWAQFWVNKIITSTPGSCPVKGKKVIPIGQAIDDTKFLPMKISKLNLNHLIHIGRFDESKRIDILIESAAALRRDFEMLRLRILGSPGNPNMHTWADLIKKKYNNLSMRGWLSFSESVQRSEVSTIMRDYGVFFHAYSGSLDKTLIEATMLRMPVVTVNPEYISEFGRWGVNEDFSLESEYKAMRSLTYLELDKELEVRLRHAKLAHSSTLWVEKLSKILTP
jgi:glycosyltransferase involved in cell wall biosynthesis